MAMLYHKTVGAGPAVILLHGFGFHSAVFNPLIVQLQSCYQVTVIDLPGYGHSIDNDIPFTLPHIAEAILAVAPLQAHYVGWSLGGLIAQYIASYFPKRINCLVAAASTPKFLATPYWPGLSHHTLDQFSNHLASSKRQLLQHFTRMQYHGHRHIKKDLEHATDPIDKSALINSLRLLSDSDLRTAITTSPCHKLYLFAEHDMIVPSNTQKELLMLPTHITSKIISNATHALFLTHPNEFISEVGGFLHAKHSLH